MGRVEMGRGWERRGRRGMCRVGMEGRCRGWRARKVRRVGIRMRLDEWEEEA